MLYLPELKNVVADFLSPPSPSLPKASATLAALAVVDPIDFEAMAAEQNHCAETQRLLSGSSLQLAFCPAGAQRLAADVSTGIFHPIVPQKFRKDIFSIFTTFHIPGGSPPGAWYLLGLSGEDWPATSLPGRGPASTASKPRSIATCTCSSSQSPSHSNVFLTFTSMWWDPTV